ncbi:MAG: phosphoribosylaminoimidazolesuccinocarboxamide synthase [Elusimicrobia bacterium]|nr:phosphoribosylaminoimidazolesuccinocarboxamide synthase [Elusimicrobiota bacterium]
MNKKDSLIRHSPFAIRHSPALDVPGNWTLLFSGKVREIYQINDEVLALLASDRVSAFDWVLPNEIPGKGKILTQLSKFWFDKFRAIIPSHWLPARELIEVLGDLRRRTMVVRKLEIFPFEFIVRGYLAGSAWKSYKEKGWIGLDHTLRSGYHYGDKLPESLLTPSTKAREPGVHDEDVSWLRVKAALGEPQSERLRELLLALFKAASEHLESCGLILVDTKFELGVDSDGTVYLADEALTPDSSRFFWKKDWVARQADKTATHELQPVDKQIVRDYLEKEIKWDKQAPAPMLSPAVVEQTRQTYFDLFRAITGAEPEL